MQFCGVKRSLHAFWSDAESHDMADADDTFRTKSCASKLARFLHLPKTVKNASAVAAAAAAAVLLSVPTRARHASPAMHARDMSLAAMTCSLLAAM